MSKPFDENLAAARRAAGRVRRLGAEFIRVMSYPIGDPANLREEERFHRLRGIVALFDDTGCTVVHENCGNYAGMGWTYPLRLLENVSSLRQVFDLGNTVSDRDYALPAPHPFQSAWEFYQHVKPFTPYIHIKDARWNDDFTVKTHVFPGEGTADVRRIVEA